MYSSVIRKSDNKPSDVFKNPVDWQPNEIKPRAAKPLDIFGNFSILKIFAPKTSRQEVVLPPKPKVKDVFGKTVVQLKELLRQRGLPVSGLKQDLISRLSTPPISPTNGGGKDVSTTTNNVLFTNRIPIIASSTIIKTQKTTPISRPATTSNTNIHPKKLSSSSSSSSSITKPYLLQFDGGSRGNPGHAGSGSVILDGETGREVWQSYTYVGPSCTNNVAEYRGLIEGLRQAVAMRLPHVLIQGDSQLVLKQVEGTYKVKHADMKVVSVQTDNDRLTQPKPNELSYQVLHKQAMDLLRQLPSYELQHIPRALNGRADELSNQAMDRRRSSSSSQGDDG